METEVYICIEKISVIFRILRQSGAGYNLYCGLGMKMLCLYIVKWNIIDTRFHFRNLKMECDETIFF